MSLQVTGEAQGSEDSIKSFLKEINSGPSAAKVVKIEKEEIKMKVRTFQSGFSAFATTGATSITLDVLGEG